MLFIARLLAWSFGLLCLILSIFAASESMVASTVLFLLLAVLLIPPARRAFERATKRTLPRKTRLLCLGVLGLLTLIVLGAESSARERAIAAAEHERRTAWYRDHKDAVVDSLKAALSGGNYRAAILQADRYSWTGDSSVATLKELASAELEAALAHEKHRQMVAEQEMREAASRERREQILAKLRSLPPDNVARNVQLYGELLELSPENPTYQAKYDHYNERVRAIQEEQRLVMEAAARRTQEQADRKRRIEAQFSSWDGAHRNLTTMIKSAMNDPSSYKHDETEAWDMGDHLIVRTSFRGKNAFGGVVRNWVKAKIDLDGNVIAIIEQGP